MSLSDGSLSRLSDEACDRCGISPCCRNTIATHKVGGFIAKLVS